RRAASSPVAGATHLGNLVAGRDLIVSMGASHICVYPQARQALEHLESEGAHAPFLPARALEVARLEMTLGELDRAEQHLEEVRRKSGGTAEAGRAVDLLRSLLAARLLAATPPGHQAADTATRARDEALLERLESLSASPDERGRYLLER